MIFVTGATGLVGSHLIYSLIEKGLNVRALYRKNIPVFKGSEQVQWIHGDLLDVNSLQEAMQGVTQVYHCAAIVAFSPKQAAAMLQANVEGTANVVNACIQHQIQKLVYVSSVAALGRIRENAPVDETMNWTPETSNSIYGKSKYLAEMEVWRGMGEGLNVAIVNPVIILGDFNDTPQSYTYQQLLKGRRDAFIEQGSGWGATYQKPLPFLRIDYILHDEELICTHYQSSSSIKSDHSLVEASFNISK